MPTIVIGSEVIEFPNSATDPNWAPEVIRFAQAVESALSGVVGPFDVPPSSLNIDSDTYNPTAAPFDIPNLSFSIAAVRGAFIRIAVGRTTDTNSAYELTDIMIMYNPGNAPGSKWELARSTVGNAQIDFFISDNGQVSFTTTAIPGTAGTHQGLITYNAQALKSTP